MLATCLKTDNLPLTVMGLCPLLLVSSSTLNAMVMGSVFFYGVGTEQSFFIDDETFNSFHYAITHYSIANSLCRYFS